MNANLEHLGYLAVIGGTLLEGETILILAGFAAHRGYLRLQWVLGAAFLGSLIGDQFFFFLGRRYGLRLLAGHPRWQNLVEKGQKLVERYRLTILLSFRFLYGLRIALPVSFGMSKIRGRTFLLFNGAGGIVWVVVFGGAGYLFGQGMERLVGRMQRYELYIVLGLAVAGLSIRVVHYLWKHRKAEGPGDEQRLPTLIPGQESKSTRE